MCNAHHSVTVQYVQRYSFASQLSTVNQSIWHVASTQRLTENHFANYPGKFRRINQKSRPPLKNGCSALKWIWVLWHKFSFQKTLNHCDGDQGDHLQESLSLTLKWKPGGVWSVPSTRLYYCIIPCNTNGMIPYQGSEVPLPPRLLPRPNLSPLCWICKS